MNKDEIWQEYQRKYGRIVIDWDEDYDNICYVRAQTGEVLGEGSGDDYWARQYAERNATFAMARKLGTYWNGAHNGR